MTSDPHTSPKQDKGGQLRVAGMGLVECFLHLLDVDALLMVGGLMFGQNTQEWPQFEPPLLLRDAAIPIRVFLQVNNWLEPVEGSTLDFPWGISFPYNDKPAQSLYFSCILVNVN